jgi:HlyD family secretion protein
LDGRARLRQIEIGERNMHIARIVSGLATGEQVLLHPSDRIREGTRVAIRQ